MTTTTTSGSTTTTTVNVPLPTDVVEPLPKATATTIRSTSTSQQSEYIHKGADYIMKDAMKQTIDRKKQTNGPTTGRRRESFERLQRQMIHGVIQHRNEAPCRSARDSLNVETMTIKKKKQQRQRPPTSTRNTSSTTTTSTLTSNNPSNDNNNDHHDNNKENQITGSTNNMPATTTTTTAVKSTRSLMTIQTERTQKRDNLTHWYDQEMEQDEEEVHEQDVQQQYTTSTPLRTRTATTRTTASPKHINSYHQPLMSVTKETPQQQSITSAPQRRTRTNNTTTPRRSPNPPPPPSPFSRTTPSSSRRSNRNGERQTSNYSDSHTTPPQTQSQLQGTLSPGERSTFVTSIKADYTSPSSNSNNGNSTMRSPVAVTYFTENRHVQQQQRQRQTSTTSTTEGHRGTLLYGTNTTTTNDDDNNSFGNASIPWARTTPCKQPQQEQTPSSKKLTFQDMLYYAFAVCRAPDVNRSVLIEDDEEPSNNTICMAKPSTKHPASMPLSSSPQRQNEAHNHHVTADASRDLSTTKRDDAEDDVQSQTTQDLLDSVAMRTPARSSKPYFVDWTSPASCCSQGTSRTRTTTTSATPSQYTANSAIMSTQGLYRGCK